MVRHMQNNKSGIEIVHLSPHFVKKLPFFERVRYLLLNKQGAGCDDTSVHAQLMNDMLELKIYQPYLISKQMKDHFLQTGSQFNDLVEPEKLSLLDILNK
mmetsp:Transcript_41158/g.62581  ORF Transcript_41158/g.62581 Transcript_41158/m.62581 type:complete len:100 (+) Transcript_41158:1329-1628(+)